MRPQNTCKAGLCCVSETSRIRPMEQMPEGLNNTNKAAPLGRGVEKEWIDTRRSEELERLGKRYKEVRIRIAGLEQDLDKGTDHAIRVQDPKIRDLAIEVGRKVSEELDTLKKEKEDLEAHIHALDGTLEEEDVAQ